MDDAEEMRATDEAYDILGFADEEKKNMYRGSAAIMWLGNAKFKQKGDQAEPDGVHEVTKAAELLGLDADYLVETLIKPKLKVGKEFVKKGQTADQVSFSVSATCKSLYARMFDWMVAGVNKTLDTPNPRVSFMGVLDIAGFEIFDLNVLEQLLINYTNERLQQFFNHHMFVVEQEEYKKEGIEWKDVDFGMNLIHTIELIEKKMGILSMLEEECIVPKATDKTYLEKMMNKHLGKHNSFAKPKPPKKGMPEAHFALHHYAGTVGYNVTGWLFKNKDPVNDAVIGMMQGATNAVTALVFQETGEKKKGASMMTISAAHRESLMKLMTNLHSTHPHFVRCIIPNEIKKSGHIDAPLVMHQLNCNGVLEGIRICMLGLPNKVPHADFMTRYSIVAPKIFADLAGNAKECAQKALVAAGMDPDSFRCGSTKIMFRAGMLSSLEEIREGALSKIFVKMQCQARRVLVHVTYQGKIAEKKGISSIQRNIRLYYTCRDWAWYKFYTMIKGEMGALKKKQAEEERRKQMAEGLAKFQAILAQAAAEREAAAAANEEAKAKIAAIKGEMEFLGSYAGEQAEQIKAAEAAADSALTAWQQYTAHIDSERASLKNYHASTKAALTKAKDDPGKELAAAKANYEVATGGYQKLKGKAIALEADKTAMKGQVTVIADALAALDKKAAAALVEKREMWSTISACKFTASNHQSFLRL